MVAVRAKHPARTLGREKEKSEVAEEDGDGPPLDEEPAVGGPRFAT